MVTYRHVLSHSKLVRLTRVGMTRKTGSYLVPPYFSSYPTTVVLMLVLVLVVAEIPIINWSTINERVSGVYVIAYIQSCVGVSVDTGSGRDP